LFGLGAAGLLVRRNPLVMLMCVELMLNAVNLSFVAFSRMHTDLAGLVGVVYVLVGAAAEAAVGRGITVAVLRRKPHATADDVAYLRG
jgi:NADH-quinone oxidoreductase subunit K